MRTYKYSVDSRPREPPARSENEFFAWLVAETFLNTNGIVLH
ncbi:hypothetical protein [Streptomyces sp. NPDC001076]